MSSPLSSNENDNADAAPAEAGAAADEEETAVDGVQQPLDLEDRVDDPFTLISQVEWGPRRDQVGYDTDQDLAPRPRPRPTEPCHCISERLNSSGTMQCCDDSCVVFCCQEECRASTCPAGVYCGNRRLQKRQYAATQVFDAGSNKGRGLRVVTATNKGALVGEYVGKAMRARKLKTLFRKYQYDRRLYIMALEGDVILDAREKGGVCRFINHSCDPNCRVERWKVKGIVRAAVVTTRDVASGEELTFDYQWQRQHGRAPTKCYCGSPKCRGTLEMPKSMELDSLEKELQSHWEERQYPSTADHTIVNRTVRIHSKDHEEYFLGEVTGYNPDTRLHSILYRHDMTTEVWEDLRSEETDWMILNAQMDQEYMIAKKLKPKFETDNIGHGDNDTNNNNNNTTAASTSAAEAAERSNSLTLLQAAERFHGVDDSTGNGTPRNNMNKHYLYVQTPIKQALYNKHLIERCQRNCSVVVTAQQFSKPPLPPQTEEELEKYALLDASLDGTIWKLSISGSEVAKAYSILEKNKAHLEKKLMLQLEEETTTTTSGIPMAFVNAMSTETGTPVNASATDADATTLSRSTSNNDVQMVVFPRQIVDAVKRKLPTLLRVDNKCRSVALSFAPSESKSKTFARLIIDGTLRSDVLAATEVVWNALVQLCAEAQLPFAYNTTSTSSSITTSSINDGVPCNLGLLGGTLTANQFRLLCGNNSSHEDGSDSTNDNTTQLSTTTTSSTLAYEDLRHAPFFASFQTTYKCTVWVQSDHDKGRINSFNQIVNEASPDGTKLVFLGCRRAAQDVPRLFTLLVSRASELERGVRYLYLGRRDRVYQPLMMSRNFFGFVQSITGATVQSDTMTGDHLRMDGRRRLPSQQQQQMIDLSSPTKNAMNEMNRASLAEELVRLQIELYRDHCIREQDWIFGRDWTILASLTPSVSTSMALSSLDSASAATADNSSSISSSAGGSSSSSSSSSLSSFGHLDAKSAAHGAVEIPSVVAHLGHASSVAAHAAVILYRFVSIIMEEKQQSSISNSQLKVREAVLACIFLANKCQKANKWKRLEAVLEAAYDTFYPGTKFDRDKEDVLVLEERVIAAEKEILEALDYDIFWRNIEWIVSAATGAGRMKPDFVERVFDFAFSGPVLSAGAELWLKYGVEYVFAASAAFLEANLDSLLPALSLIPLKVLAAAELLVKSAKLGRPTGKKVRLHPLLEGGKDRLEKCIPRIREACVATMNMTIKNGASTVSALASASIVDQRYKIIGEHGRRRCAIQGIPRQFVKDYIVPVIDAVAAESSCNVHIGESSEVGKEGVTFDGPWRAVAVAEHLLRVRAAGPLELARAVDASAALNNGSKIQAKIEPGRVDASDIQTSEGWEGTVQSQMSNQAVKGRRIGGKSCVAGKISEAALRRSGLRWWIPLKNGSSPSGSINDMFLVRENENESLNVLGALASAVGGRSTSFPMLASLSNQVKNGSEERFAAVSLQQWPSEKVGNKELDKSKSKERTMQMGFSAAALQEMQLLTQLHGLISLPFGHPNFVLPVGIAVAVDGERKESSSPPDEKEKESNGHISTSDPMFSLFRSNEENEKVAEKDKKVKCRPHLLLHPTPFVLNRFMSKKQLDGIELRTNMAVMTAWFHDLISALVHCHSNNVVMRTIQPDQIVIDHNGTAKFGGLYRCTVVTPEEHEESHSLWKAARSSKKEKKKKDDDEDFSNNLFVAPETLLGSPKHTKESDVWAMGSLLANLLLGKPLFVGKDRGALLTAQFKIVGTPARENFEEAAKFPHYSKPVKKYPRGVEKALEHMLKEESAQHHKAIDLVAQMLHLDPRKRCTASEALSHDYLVEYMESCGSAAFRDEYVLQWMRLKEQSLSSSSSGRDSKRAKQMLTKRKAMLMAARRAANDDDVDDLYDIDDLLDQPAKKIKS